MYQKSDPLNCLDYRQSQSFSNFMKTEKKIDIYLQEMAPAQWLWKQQLELLNSLHSFKLLPSVSRRLSETGSSELNTDSHKPILIGESQGRRNLSFIYKKSMLPNTSYVFLKCYTKTIHTKSTATVFARKHRNGAGTKLVLSLVLPIS